MTHPTHDPEGNLIVMYYTYRTSPWWKFWNREYKTIYITDNGVTA